MGGSIHVVTGGLGYSGKYIVSRLLKKGCIVRTITNSPDRPNPFGEKLDIRPMDFGSPKALTEALQGASILYNTYWVRFNHETFTHQSAVDNTRVLFKAAARAGVKRVVHVSITNPSEDSPLEYFRGKAVLEKELESSGMSYAILRPTVLFGKEDILINNIAWVLRNLPVFGLPGNGAYRLQPVYVDDLAQLAVREGSRNENTTTNAVGPETFSFRELVEAVAEAIGTRKKIVPMPDVVVFTAGRVLGKILHDVLITREEIEGLRAGLLCVDDRPRGTTKLTEWMAANASTLGAAYASELARRRPKGRKKASIGRTP